MLGTDVLLLSWPRGSKGTRKKWGHLKVENMDEAYLRNLGRGNIGVALGPISGNLISIDVDSDPELNLFLEANPELKRSLITRGKRGGNVWLRMLGPYPSFFVIKREKSTWGEFRSGPNSQTIIYGTHPDGGEYKIVNHADPLEIPFDNIRWPDGLWGRGIKQVHYELHREADEADESDEIVSSVCAPFPVPVRVFTVPEVVASCLPLERSYNHKLLHKLQRGILALESQEGVKFTLQRKRDIFDLWYSKAQPTGFLRPGQTKDEYFLEFMSSDNVKIPLGAGELLSKAIVKARTEPEPPEAAQFAESPNIRLLVCLCYQLQLMAGNEPFFLSARKAAEVLGVSWKSCANWLKGLCKIEVLHLESLGGTTTNPREASRYRYKTALSV